VAEICLTSRLHRHLTSGDSVGLALRHLYAPPGTLTVAMYPDDQGRQGWAQMTDPTRTETDDDIDPDDINVGSDGRSATGMPRWVKVFGIVVVALVLLFVVANLTGIGGNHGPGRHGGGDDQEQDSGTEDGGHDPSDWDH